MKKPERSVEEIIHIIKRYTHDRSESGYDDIMGSCGYPCRQCDKDKRMLKDIKEVLTAERQKREEVVRGERSGICQLLHNMMLPEINEDTHPEWKKKLQYNQALQNAIREIQALTQPNNHK